MRHRSYLDVNVSIAQPRQFVTGVTFRYPIFSDFMRILVACITHHFTLATSNIRNIYVVETIVYQKVLLS